MDKNTAYGLILMALVFFGFMYFTTPDPAAVEELAQNEQVVAENNQPAAAAIFSDTEREWLAKNILSNGTPVTAENGSPAVALNSGDVRLTLVGDSVFGTVSVNGKMLEWNSVVNNDLTVMTAAEHTAALDKVRALSNSIGRYGRFASFLTGESKTLTLENDVLKIDLSSKGGIVTRAELKKYDTEYDPDETKKVKNKVVMFDAESNRMSFILPLPQEISTSDLYFAPQEMTDSTVLMALNLSSDAFWGIRYTLPKGDSYMIKMEVVQKNMAPIVQSNVRKLGVNWYQEIHRQEKGRMFEERNSRLAYKFLGGSVEELSESKNVTKERQQKLKWIAFKNQFFSSVLIADKNFNSADFNSEVLKGSVYLKSLTADAEVNDYDWNAENPAGFNYYIGPNLYPLLNKIDKSTYEDENLKLTKLIPLGWPIFRWINTLIVIPVFNFLGSFGWNYGIVILVLTILLKLVLFPLTYKSYVSQAKMRILAPDIKEINEKYPGNENAMTRQQKTMALYNKAGANPMSGCLPMLLQMPILFAMFTFFPNCIELRGQSFLWAHDLAAPDAIISWSGNIPLVTEYFGNHISLFCLLMTATNIIYTRSTMQGQSNGMPGMKWMMYLMPLMFLVFFNNYAAGLSYYYFLSLLITIIQTYAIRKWFVKEEDVRRAMKENAKKPQKKSGWMARLEEMQKEQQRMMREQQKNGGARKR
ncbi:MAG: membrane protein insertase YidC [Muribaculaceae bacterium]|nr:membrane protein insertase YidC [Muribaculaceae bacterium]